VILASCSWLSVNNCKLMANRYTSSGPPIRHDKKLRSREDSKSPPSDKVSFLVAVNQTVDYCLMTSRTTPLQPNIHHTRTGGLHSRGEV